MPSVQYKPGTSERFVKLEDLGKSDTDVLLQTVTIRNVDDQLPNKRQNKIDCRCLLLPVSERDRIGNASFFSLAVFFFRAALDSERLEK